jgi:hypothetical protein
MAAARPRTLMLDKTKWPPTKQATASDKPSMDPIIPRLSRRHGGASSPPVPLISIYSGQI